MNLLKKYIAKNKTGYFFSVLFAVLGVLAGLFTYVLLSKMIIALIAGNTDFAFYTKGVLSILALLCAKEVLMGISTTISHTATYGALCEIRRDIMDKLFKMPLGNILNLSTGKLKDVIVNQVDSMETTLAHLIPEMTANIVGPVLLLVYMFVLDWRVSLLALVPLVIGMFFMAGPMKRMPKMFPKAVKIGQDMNNSIVEYINGIEVIKSFNQGDTSYKKYSDNVYTKADYYCKWMGLNNNDYAVSMSLAPMGILTIIPFGLFFCMQGSLSGAHLLMLIILSFGTISNIMQVMSYEDDMGRIKTIAGEIEKVLNSKELSHATGTQNISRYDITFDHVNFSYDDNKQVIKDVNLYINEGSVNALVGYSGSGKSTVAKLLAGFWDTDSGTITIGGIALKDMPLEQLSDAISYVSQDNYLFDISIKDNIRIGKKNATDEEIIEIAKKSGCHDFIMKLSQGYETVAGEGGGHLSGGERQRISIARAMLKDAPIVILDEATSYIDPENEAILQDAIATLVKGKTLIIIAHRLKTIADVDQIFVIHDGYVENHGTHDELLKDSPVYQELWSAAMRGEEND